MMILLVKGKKLIAFEITFQIKFTKSTRNTSLHLGRLSHFGMLVGPRWSFFSGTGVEVFRILTIASSRL
jgi:hypothetical protein